MALPLCRNASALRPEGLACGRDSRRHPRQPDVCKSGATVLGSRPADAKRKAHPQMLPVLDIGSFVHFAPLLEACQDYARCTGCRFHGLSFEAKTLAPLRDVLYEGDLVLSTSGVMSLDPLGPRLLAEVCATPIVHEFKQRLQRREPELLADLHRATDVLIKEGVRNCLRGTCQRLGLWPPLSMLSNIDANDCFYYDAQAEVPAVAQRLFNDDKRRARVRANSGGVDLEHALAATASFLLDFAQEAGVLLPAVHPRHAAFLRDFAENVAAWEKTAACCKGNGSELQARDHHSGDWSANDIAEAAALVRVDLTEWLARTFKS